jgi:ADP-ribose pyrophosphatase YjhB (NUDIX family)
MEEIMHITIRIRLLDKNDRILLVLERGDKVVNAADRRFVKPSGWGLPGGRMNPAKDASAWAAATRELREETGLAADIDPEPFRKIATGSDHEIWLFAAKNPRGEIAITERDMIIAEWKDWKFIQPNEFGRAFLDYQGKSFAVYKSHIPLIHGMRPQ